MVLAGQGNLVDNLKYRYSLPLASRVVGRCHLQGVDQQGMEDYQTAWFLLHRLRRAMVNEVRSKLRGFIEADETIVGGPVRGKHGRAVTDLATKTLVFGAVEVIDYTDKRGEDAQKAGRIRLATTPRADGQSIKQFLAQNVEKRSSIRTDGWGGVLQIGIVCLQSRSDFRNEGIAHSSSIRQSQNMAEWHASWCQSKIPTELSE
jgi:hypothetical protein